LTSDCDWWTFIEDRVKWKKGNYKVIIGGAGLLNVRPFLPFADYFVLGRGEDIIIPLVEGNYDGENVIDAKNFKIDNQYYIKQAEVPYPYEITLEDGSKYKEDVIGCNHRCLFCGYTYHRKQLSPGPFHYKFQQGGLWKDKSEVERALLDYADGSCNIDFRHLRITAIDGFSERLRVMVGKKITNEIVSRFLKDMIESNAEPHKIKFFNICGYPTETEEDWFDLIKLFEQTEQYSNEYKKQWWIFLHMTPFRPMPGTPLACAPMSYRDYRGEFGRVLGKTDKKSILYQGKNMWACDSMYTESLPTVALSAIAHCGTENDTENIIRLCKTPKFWRGNSQIKKITLEKYFDVKTLFGSFTSSTLPTRYLRTYAHIEKYWK